MSRAMRDGYLINIMNVLSIDLKESKKLGNCYWAYIYEVKSTNHKLTKEELRLLKNMGFMIGGQTFEFTEKPQIRIGYDDVYVYEVVVTVDSSD